MNPDEITAVVAATAQHIEDGYVIAPVATAAAAHLRAACAEGRYAACADPEALARAVTADLEEASRDLHLRLLFHADGAVGEEDEESLDAHWREQARQTAGGMRRVERLEGNVALVEVTPVIGHPAHAGDAISAAMSLAADADALVLDVRGCRGGSPDGVALICSYVFGEEPVRLSNIESRAGGVRQFWTQGVVPGRRLGPDRPVAVLVSGETFSGGEALAFDLQESGRATVVGHTTRGGAHPRIGLVVHPHLELTLPIARSRSALTGDNWEGRGVAPDIEVAAPGALDAALAHLRGVMDPLG